MLREISLDEAKKMVAEGEIIYSTYEPFEQYHMVNVTDQYKKVFPSDARYLVDEPEENETKRKGGRKSTIDVGKLLALHEAGWTQRQIAEELKTSQATVTYYLKKQEAEDGKAQE